MNTPQTEPQTFEDLMRLHGFSFPRSGDERTRYKRMERITDLIASARRKTGLPVKPCRFCGMTASGCWMSDDGRESSCINAPRGYDSGVVDGCYEESYD